MPLWFLIVLFLTRGSAIATDVAVLVLTWVKTFQHWRELRRLKMGSSVSTLLLRDGKVCYPPANPMGLTEASRNFTGTIYFL